MTAKEQAIKFVDEYKEELAKVNDKILECSSRIEELSLEIKYHKEVSIPEAIEVRVLQGDSTLENKLKKALSKFEGELAAKEEELIVLKNFLQRFKHEAANKVKKLEKLFQDEKKVSEQRVYSKLMNAKYQYVKSLIEEGKTLQEIKDVDVQLQEILYNAGWKNSVYTQLDVNSASIPTHVNRHNGIYLALPHNDVVKILKNTATDDELAYLEKFKDTKSL